MTLFEKSTSMQIVPFPTHYQLVYTNFDFSSFSLISCHAIHTVLQCKIIFFVFRLKYSDKIDMHLVLSTMGRNVQKES